MSFLTEGQLKAHEHAIKLRSAHGDKALNPDRKLTGNPKDYLTGLNPSGKTIVPRETFGHQPVDIEAFRKECEDIGDD